MVVIDFFLLFNSKTVYGFGPLEVDSNFSVLTLWFRNSYWDVKCIKTRSLTHGIQVIYWTYQDGLERTAGDTDTLTPRHAPASSDTPAPGSNDYPAPASFLAPASNLSPASAPDLHVVYGYDIYYHELNKISTRIIIYLTIRASLAPRYLLFLLKVVGTP